MIYKKNDKKNNYCAVTFTSSHGNSRTLLSHNIDPNSKEPCFIMNNPVCSKRNSFMYKKKYKNYKVHKEDKHIVNRIKNKK
ncbi:MAG: hypothetical protein ACI311_06750 [Bacilli bacterium]